MNMSRLISLFCLMLGAGCCLSAQIRILPREVVESFSMPHLSPDSSALRFDVSSIDSAPLNEDDEPSFFTYPFTNVSDRTIRIERLVSTCSCLSARCDRMILKAGESGQITARYDPKGHPGRFERKIFVYTEREKEPAAVLRLNVMVENGADMTDDWPVHMGYIRLRRSEMRISKGCMSAEKFRFINLSSRPVKLECISEFLPECLSFRTEPSAVQPGMEGEIIISYDPSQGGERHEAEVILKNTGVPPSQSVITVVFE